MGLGSDLEGRRQRSREARKSQKVEETVEAPVDLASEERKSQLRQEVREGVDAVFEQFSSSAESIRLLDEPSAQRAIPSDKAIKQGTREYYSSRQLHSIMGGLAYQGGLPLAREYADIHRREGATAEDMMVGIAIHVTNAQSYNAERIVEEERIDGVQWAMIQIAKAAEGSEAWATLQSSMEAVEAEFPDLFDDEDGRRPHTRGMIWRRLEELAREGLLEFTDKPHLTGVTAPDAWPDDVHPHPRPIATARARLLAEMFDIEESISHRPYFEREAAMLFNACGYRTENWPTLGRAIREVVVAEFKRSVSDPAGMEAYPQSLEERREALRADARKALESVPDLEQKVFFEHRWL